MLQMITKNSKKCKNKDFVANLHSDASSSLSTAVCTLTPPHCSRWHLSWQLWAPQASNLPHVSPQVGTSAVHDKEVWLDLPHGQVRDPARGHDPQGPEWQTSWHEWCPQLSCRPHTWQEVKMLSGGGIEHLFGKRDLNKHPNMSNLHDFFFISYFKRSPRVNRGCLSGRTLS